jgi:tetratricopeptide (TPR) repeat protein
MTRQTKESFSQGEMKIAQRFGLNSKQMAALIQSGYMLYTQGRLQEAKTVFEGLAILDDKNAYVQGILGAIYQKEKNFDAAIAHYSAALDAFPSDVYSLSNRGEVHLKLGNFSEAAADLKKAIELDVNHRNSAANRARALAKLTHEALKLMESKILSAHS